MKVLSSPHRWRNKPIRAPVLIGVLSIGAQVAQAAIATDMHP
jgi:hypothetical protein